MQPYRRFSRMLAIAAVSAGAVAVLIASLFSKAAAQGTALGAIAAGVALWLMAQSMTRFAYVPASRLPSIIYRGTVGRMGIYAIVFLSAYFLDRSSYHGILGAVAGLFLVYVVMIVVGFVTLRSKPAGK